MTLVDLLHLVETSDKPLTCGELAEQLGKDPAVVTGMLDWLARSGRLHVYPATPAHGTCDLSTCGVAGPCDSCPFAAVPDTGRRFLAAHRAAPAAERRQP